MRFSLLICLAACAAEPAPPPLPAPMPSADEAEMAPPMLLGDYLPTRLAGLERTTFGQYQGNLLSAALAQDTAEHVRLCGGVAAAEADYGPEHVLLIDMGTAQAALCLYRLERTADWQPASEFSAEQGEGSLGARWALVRRGRHCLLVKGSEQTPGGGKNATRLVSAIVAALPNPQGGQ